MTIEYDKDILRLYENKESSQTWYVISGSPENELRKTYMRLDLQDLFTGIYGSPQSKVEIARGLELVHPVLVIGDSITDYNLAEELNFDFLYVMKWSEDTYLKELFRKGESLSAIKSIGDLLCAE